MLRNRLTSLPGVTACAFFSLLFLAATFAHAEAPSRNIFCILQSTRGIYTLDLRVPKEGSGPCEVITMTPTMISDHVSNRSLSSYPVATNPGFRHSQLPRPIDFASTYLGTLTTLKGETYTACSLLTREKDGIIVIHAQGLSKIVYPDLSPDDRKRLHP